MRIRIDGAWIEWNYGDRTASSERNYGRVGHQRWKRGNSLFRVHSHKEVLGNKALRTLRPRSEHLRNSTEIGSVCISPGSACRKEHPKNRLIRFVAGDNHPPKDYKRTTQ